MGGKYSRIILIGFWSKSRVKHVWGSCVFSLVCTGSHYCSRLTLEIEVRRASVYDPSDHDWRRRDYFLEPLFCSFGPYNINYIFGSVRGLVRSEETDAVRGCFGRGLGYLGG